MNFELIGHLLSLVPYVLFTLGKIVGNLPDQHNNSILPGTSEQLVGKQVLFLVFCNISPVQGFSIVLHINFPPFGIK
jgi:hypothetical protein